MSPTSTMKFNILLSLLLFLTSCGIPDSSSFETLLAPFLLDDKGTPGTPGAYPQCTLTSNGYVIVELKVMIFNTEISFSGYDVYSTQSFSGLTDLESRLRTTVNSHIISVSSSSSQFSPSIEKFWIIKNNNNLPTIVAGSPEINGYNKQPTIAYIRLDRDPSNHSLNKQQYGFTITAVSLPNVTESIYSNAIAIDSSKATTTPSYCGLTN